MAQQNTGPPWYARDTLEAGAALDHSQQPSRRAAFRASIQARLRGSTSAAIQNRNNWMPLKRR